MSIGVVSQNGHIAYGIKRYLIDLATEVDNLSLDDTPGSEAYCIENGKMYILTNRHRWTEKLGNTGSGSGAGGTTDGPLSDPEILSQLY